MAHPLLFAYPIALSFRPATARSPRCTAANTVCVVSQNVDSQGHGSERDDAPAKSPQPKRQQRKPRPLPKAVPPVPRDPVALGFADDFDRDYYEDLKREYADNPLVTIISRDDYDLDLSDVEGVEWIDEDFRGRDLEEVKRNLADRPIPDDLPLSFAPLELTDFHSKSAVDNFNENARTFDPTTGRPWEDVPHDMHRYPECEYSDFRHDDAVYEEDDGQHLSFQPLERPEMSEEEEILALRRAAAELQELDAMQHEEALYAADGAVRLPSQDDFERWSRAAEERGGNVTEHESFGLPPFGLPNAQREQRETPPRRPRTADIPRQFSAVADAHEGSWCGQIEVLALPRNLEDDTESAPVAIFDVESSVDIADDDWERLVWESAIHYHGKGDEILSVVELASNGERGEKLAPERAVFPCGSYITQNLPGCTLQKVPISISQASIAALTEGCRGVTELSLMKGEGIGAERTRIIICGRDAGVGNGKKKNGYLSNRSPVLSHIITVREHRAERGEALEIGEDETSVAGMMRGNWSGEGLSLHPMFPGVAAGYVGSTQKWEAAEGLSVGDVTWGTNMGSMEMDFDGQPTAKNERPRSVGGSTTAKRSKRVRAAADHDARRLAQCTLLASERIGYDPAETKHPWRITHQALAKSPRFGKFVSDAVAVAVPGNHAVCTTAGKISPAYQNFLSVVEMDAEEGRRRRRLVACRNCEGYLVGALMLHEENASEN